MRKSLDVAFTSDEEEFIRWLADRDGLSVMQELRILLYNAVDDHKVLYFEEFMNERANKNM